MAAIEDKRRSVGTPNDQLFLQEPRTAAELKYNEVMPDQLVAFLRTKKQAAEVTGIDWEAKKGAWLRSVDALYASIQDMLRDAIASKDVVAKKLNTEITEDFLGTYSIPILRLSVANERVEFLPVGVTVAGASGRVDIRGARDTVTLLRDATPGIDDWKIVIQRIPKFTTAPLDRESLRYALERVMLPLP